jgi:hypothetical protein
MCEDSRGCVRVDIWRRLFAERSAARWLRGTGGALVTASRGRLAARLKVSVD